MRKERVNRASGFRPSTYTIRHDLVYWPLGDSCGNKGFGKNGEGYRKRDVDLCVLMIDINISWGVMYDIYYPRADL